MAAFETAGKTSGNRVVEMMLDKLKNQVSKGEKIADTLAQNNIFTPLAVNLIAGGEETGDLPTLLEKIALFYEEEVDNAVNTLTSLLEPFIILFLGVLVGGIVLAMFLPILSIMKYIGK